MKRLNRTFLILAISLAMLFASSSALAQEPEPTAEPTEEATAEPTEEPRVEPTEEPTAEPTEEPTDEPTEEPTTEPTDEAPAEPTEEPTAEPTAEPTEQPTAEPTEQPTAEPTDKAPAEPTEEPTAEPTEEPTAEPTEEPTAEPTVEAVAEPVIEDAGDINAQVLTTIPFTSKVIVMDMSGSGADFSLSYFSESTSTGGGGAAQGVTNHSIGSYESKVIDQSTDVAVSSLKGSGILQSNNPIAAAVFFGGTSGSVDQYEAYDTGGLYKPNTQFFIPNANKNVSNVLKIFSEIAIMNTDTNNPATVDVFFTIQNITQQFTVAPQSTFYYNLQDDAAINDGQQPIVVTSTGGEEIMVINNGFATGNTLSKWTSHTPGFTQADAASRQYLPNVQSRLPNGLSVITFVQNVSASPVDVTVTFIPDPLCAGCTQFVRTGNVQPNAVISFNPRVDFSMPAGWFGSVIASTDDNSDSIIAFGNQAVAGNPVIAGNTAGYAGRGPNNTNTTIFCPYNISGLPDFSASSLVSSLLIQNVSTGTTDVTVDFVPGIGSPNTTSVSHPATTLTSGERLGFNFRGPDNPPNSINPLPQNWYGSARITTNPPANIAAVVNIFQKKTSSTDPLGTYNCISPE